MAGVTVSPDEVARFDALAARWWDPDGPMRPLHQMNPARVAWIAERSGPAAAAADGRRGDCQRRRTSDVGG